LVKNKRIFNRLLQGLRRGLSVPAACGYAGISERTYYYFIKSAKQCTESAVERKLQGIEIAYAQGVYVHEQLLQAQSVVDSRIAFWLLQRRDKMMEAIYP
jgi:hypothetical protein